MASLLPATPFVRKLPGGGAVVVDWPIVALATVPALITGVVVLAVWLLESRQAARVARSLRLADLREADVADLRRTLRHLRLAALHVTQLEALESKVDTPEEAAALGAQFGVDVARIEFATALGEVNALAPPAGAPDETWGALVGWLVESSGGKGADFRLTAEMADTLRAKIDAVDDAIRGWIAG